MSGPWEQYKQAGPWEAYQKQPAPQRADEGSFLDDARNAMGGVAQSGMGIASNLMRPFEALIPGGEDFDSGNQKRMARVKGRFERQGYDPESLSFKGGKLGGEVALTAPIGGALAKGASMIPAVAKYAPNLPVALKTAGFRINAPAATTAKQLAKNVGTRVGAGATVGAATAGAVDFDNTGTGALIGGALPPAVRFAGDLGGAAKAALIDPLVNQKAIIGKTLARAVGESNIPAVTANLGRTAKTPGVQFSAGQRTGDPAILAFEDALRATNPGGELTANTLNNNARLSGALRTIAQDENAIGAAVQARKAATAPLYQAASNSDQLADPTRVVKLIDRIVEKSPANRALVTPLNSIRESLFEAYPVHQRGADAWKAVNEVVGSRMSASDAAAVRMARTVMDRVRKGSIDAQTALSQLKMAKATSKTAADAIEAAKQYMKTPDHVVMQKPNQIMSAIDNIKAMLGNQENAFVRSELNTIKRSLEHQLAKAAPEFRQAEQTYAQMSRPVNQMQIGQQLANKLIPSTAGDVPSRLNAAQLATAMRNPDQVARTATGFKRARFDSVMTPEQAATIRGVTEDASRIADMSTLGAGYGSPTARRQAIGNFIGDNLATEYPLISKTIGALGNVPLVNMPVKALGAAGSAVGSRINQNMAAELETMLASNPKALETLLIEAQRRMALPTYEMNPYLRAGLLNLPSISASP